MDLDAAAETSGRSARFTPTELDLALQRDPVAEALQKELLAASRPGDDVADPSVASHGTQHGDPRLEGGQASREGQRETAAASLAGGMIAAEGRPVTAAEAVQKVRAVQDELDKGDDPAPDRPPRQA